MSTNAPPPFGITPGTRTSPGGESTRSVARRSRREGMPGPFFRRAIERDPNFAAAHRALADVDEDAEESARHQPIAAWRCRPAALAPSAVSCDTLRLVTREDAVSCASSRSAT